MSEDHGPDILTSHEVAKRYRVAGRQPARWVAEGRLGEEGRVWFRTPGGQLRYRRSELDRLDAQTLAQGVVG